MVKDWWDGLTVDAQDWFVISGLLMLFVVGIVVGVVGVANVATLEPLAHLGFGTAISGLLGTLFTCMARIM